MLGRLIAPYDPPIRVAEEFAMLDVCRGRLVAGYPVGTSMDTTTAEILRLLERGQLHPSKPTIPPARSIVSSVPIADIREPP